MLAAWGERLQISIVYTDLRRHSTVELWLMCLNVNPLCWFSLPSNLQSPTGLYIDLLVTGV